MQSYSMWPFVSDFFHLMWYFQGSSMLYHVPGHHSFLWLCNIPPQRQIRDITSELSLKWDETLVLTWVKSYLLSGLLPTAFGAGSVYPFSWPEPWLVPTVHSCPQRNRNPKQRQEDKERNYPRSQSVPWECNKNTREPRHSLEGLYVCPACVLYTYTVCVCTPQTCQGRQCSCPQWNSWRRVDTMKIPMIQ